MMIAWLWTAVIERRNFGYMSERTRAALAAYGLTVPQVESFLAREGV